MDRRQRSPILLPQMVESLVDQVVAHRVAADEVEADLIHAVPPLDQQAEVKGHGDGEGVEARTQIRNRGRHVNLFRLGLPWQRIIGHGRPQWPSCWPCPRAPCCSRMYAVSFKPCPVSMATTSASRSTTP